MKASTRSRILPCVEHGPVDILVADLLDKSGNLRLDLGARDKGYFSISLQREGQLTLRAGHHVGLIPLTSEVALHVTPRVPLVNLARIVAIAKSEPRVLSIVRAYEDTPSQDASVRDLLAHGLIAALGEIARSGMLRSYSRREEVGSTPRGSFDFALTVREQVRNRPYVAGSRWFEREVDNGANRTLLFALHTIAAQFSTDPTLTQGGRRLIGRLNAMRQMFQGVTLDRSRSFLSDPVVSGFVPVPSTRAYYREALDVALSIIRRSGLSLDSTDGRLRLPSVVFDMSEVFERFIRNSLANAARDGSWKVEVRDGNTAGRMPLFAMSPTISALVGDGVEAVRHPATPDIVLTEAGEAHRLIGEVKYVPLGNSDYLRDGVNQAVTYGATYGCDRVLLIHPWNGNAPRGLTTPGAIGGIDVWVYRFDLGAADLDEEVANFASAVEALV